MLGHAAALEPSAFFTQRILLIIIIIKFTRHACSNILCVYNTIYVPIHGFFASGGVGTTKACVIPPSCSDTAAGGGRRVVSLWWYTEDALGNHYIS